MLQQLLQGRYKKLGFLSMITGAIGMFLLFMAVQLHADWIQINKGSEGYVIINKPVNILSTLGFAAGFTPQEIEKLEQQDFINRVGAFQANDFRVSMGSNRLGFRTDAFFESVSSEFVDVAYSKWDEYQPGDVVPIVLSADYLALYNFGFAPSQGLPQFSANTINKVNIDITIQGNGRIGRFKGNIIGFSKRLNSIIVPNAFLSFANKNYGNGNLALPSRLILEVENPKAASLIEYAKKNGYELNVNKAFGEETQQLIQRSILLISGIGFLVLLLTLIVFYLSYKLIIEERVRDIQILFTQGYAPKTISRLFNRYSTLILAASIIIAIILAQASHLYIAQQLSQIGYDVKAVLSWQTWLLIIILAILLLTASRWIVTKTIHAKYI